MSSVGLPDQVDTPTADTRTPKVPSDLEHIDLDGRPTRLEKCMLGLDSTLQNERPCNLLVTVRDDKEADAKSSERPVDVLPPTGVGIPRDTEIERAGPPAYRVQEVNAKIVEHPASFAHVEPGPLISRVERVTIGRFWPPVVPPSGDDTEVDFRTAKRCVLAAGDARTFVAPRMHE